MQRKIPLYGPIDALEDFNRDARLELTDILAQNGVNVAAERAEIDEARPRGLAFFFAFDPWMTSLRCPRGSVGFFSAAKKNRLITDPEAADLEDALVKIGGDIATCYKGPFESFFKDRKVNQILNARGRQVMALAGLPVLENSVDSLFEACPFPLHPGRHLNVQFFETLETAEEVEFYSRSPWLAWTEALDLVCLGPWAGLKPESILDMVNALERPGDNLTATTIQNSFIGHKVTLPVNSRGLQGVVFGFFRNPPNERVKIFHSLLQFGGALADVYADLRWTAFVEALRSGSQSEAEMAREVVNVVSPISKVIVQRGTSSAGYRILEQEGGYWGGYEELTKSELAAAPSVTRFEVNGPEGLKIFIEPLTGLSSICSEFVQIRLQSNLDRALAQISQPKKSEILPRQEVEDLLSRFEESKTSAPSVPKLRKYYVVSAVQQRWSDGNVKITNAALKSFLEGELGHEVGSGFQVTSFISETEDIFSRKVNVTKESSNSISLLWNPGLQSA